MITCNNCKKEVEPVLTDSGQHIKASCSECKRYIKFMPQEIKASDFVMPYGKHKGRTLGEIKINDFDYLQWLYDNSKSRIKDLVDKVLSEN